MPWIRSRVAWGAGLLALFALLRALRRLVDPADRPLALVVAVAVVVLIIGGTQGEAILTGTASSSNRRGNAAVRVADVPAIAQNALKIMRVAQMNSTTWTPIERDTTQTTTSTAVAASPSQLPSNRCTARLARFRQSRYRLTGNTSHACWYVINDHMEIMFENVGQ